MQWASCVQITCFGLLHRDYVLIRQGRWFLWATKECIEIWRTSVSPTSGIRPELLCLCIHTISMNVRLLRHAAGHSDTPNVRSDPSTRIDRRMLLKPAWAFYISLGTRLIKPVALSVRNVMAVAIVCECMRAHTRFQHVCASTAIT